MLFTRASQPTPSKCYPPSKLAMPSPVYVEVILYVPPLALIESTPRAAIALHKISRYRGEGDTTLFDDPGAGVQSLRSGNTILPRSLVNIDGRWRLHIPTLGHASFEGVYAILANLPKVDENINPGGMFPWTFGNYVRRFLHELDAYGILATPDLLTPDQFYEQFLAQKLGSGRT
ncbi:hypothetical protein NLJ89_g10069 [Agrocybe chaxingu]|uniref:Uncharacterized protein n=1 Tax=Agrocybe chaxingu TaxID=84603 RepID=A0A9W8JS11_9AGAR|nr:hypothetical protein NLJ89_g10069 [Agrocybe chaxingu]